MATPRKVALVTGASRGIGRAISLALAHEGYHLALVARRRSGLNEVGAACRRLGVDAICFPVDLTDCDAMERVLHQCVQQLGNLTALVNNAGYNHTTSVLRASRRQW